jgi:hypothetical protein
MPVSNLSPIPSSSYVQAVTATASGIGASNIPGSANYAEGFVRLNSVVETRDGTTPTATLGKQWDIGDIILLRSRDELVGFSAIEQSSTDASIDWEFFNQTPGG